MSKQSTDSSSLWTILPVAPEKRNGRVYLRCRCKCGVERWVGRPSLRSGASRGCGCASWKHGHANNRSAEYRAWSSARNRCNNPKNRVYALYGGRGIKMCARWDSFASFLEDVGERPSARHSLGRINGDGDYCPENCRWETAIQQQRNRRDNVILAYQGKSLVASAWAAELGISPKLIYWRLAAKWPIERVLSV